MVIEMKFCQTHWDALKAAIESRGLGHLIKKSGEDAVEAVARQVQGIDDKSDFDPLMGAYWRIMARIVEIRGLMYMGADAPYGGCPMCEPDEAFPDWANNW